jgi:hypothetical protein
MDGPGFRDPAEWAICDLPEAVHGALLCVHDSGMAELLRIECRQRFL